MDSLHRQRREPAWQALVELLLGRGLVQRIEARAAHHRLADELCPGGVHRLEAGARRDLDAPAPQHRRALHLGQHRLVEAARRGAAPSARAASPAQAATAAVHGARNRNADAARDAEQEPDLVQAHRARHGEHGLVARGRCDTPELRQMRVREVRVRQRRGPDRPRASPVARSDQKRSVASTGCSRAPRLPLRRPRVRRARASATPGLAATRAPSRTATSAASTTSMPIVAMAQRTWRFRSTRLSR